MSVDDIVPREHGAGERDFVLRAVFVAPDKETAQRMATEVVGPLLYGRLIDWTVEETREFQSLGDQAEGFLADAAAEPETGWGVDEEGG